jgi:hypothetical protein
MSDNRKDRPPAVPPELLNRPRPRGMIEAKKYLRESTERGAQANVDAVEILIEHRKVLAFLKQMADLDLHHEVKDSLAEFIAIADRTLIAARGE